MKNHILYILLGGLSLLSLPGVAQRRPAAQVQSFPYLMEERSGSSRGQAQGLFQKYFHMKPEDALVAQSSWQDELGFTHDRYQQYYRKVKVEGAVYTVHARNGIIKTLSGEFKGLQGIDVTPSVTAAQAFQYALNHIHAQTYAWDPAVQKGYPDYRKPDGELVIFGGSAEARSGPALAWKFDIYAASPLYRADVYVDAHTGAILFENHRIHTADAPASGRTLYNGTRNFTADNTGTVYRLRQTVSGGGIETYSLNNGTAYTSATDITSATASFTADSTANQAHWGAEQTYAYFKEKHNRNSYNNTGGVIKSYVHYSTNYVNAFWDGSRMTYGDGNLSQGYKPLVSLDVCGHEITHGVTTFSANLTYSSESGALNESFSDIFGEAVEYYAQGSNDWLMGCDLGVNGCGAFRSMANPNLYQDPDTYKGAFWYSGSGDNYGVHTNSGVQNKWFYILVNGESGTNDLGYSYSVNGIGWEKAARIAYRNLTVYLTASSTFLNARAGAIQAATDLFGAGSAEVIATTNAWYAVGVGCEYGTVCYCSSSGTSADEWIAGVTIGSFSNTSTGVPYTYYAAKPIALTAGISYPIRLTPGFSGAKYPEYWRIWIDYNRDNDFDDAGELAFDAGSAIDSAKTGTLVVPATASGSTRMRVTMKYASGASPCENFQWGEVEDYPVNFSSNAPDTLAPSAPVLTNTSKTSTQLIVSWTAATDNVGVTGYDVYVNGIKNNSALVTALTYTLNGLSPSTLYTIYVTAKDQAGNSTNSNLLNITTAAPADTQAPTAPVLSGTAVGQATINLSWTAATDNVGVTGYDVYINGVKHNSAVVTTLAYTLSGLNASTAYTLYVLARDQAGNTTNSNTITVTTPDTEAPTAPVLTGTAVSQSTISLNWTAATDNVGVIGYEVYVNGAKQNSSAITLLTYTLNGLTPGNNYSIWVTAIDLAGNTTLSNTISLSTSDTQAPTAPVLSGTAISQSAISLNWTAATDNVGVIGYEVYVNEVKQNTALITGLSYTVSGLNAAAFYNAYVVAWDQSGNTTNSNGVGITMPDTEAPSASVLSSPSKSQTSIDLGWSAATDNVEVAGYDVFVDGVKHNTSTITGLSYTVSGLMAATSYSIYVNAKDAAGNSTASNTLNIITSIPLDVEAPSVPVLSSPLQTQTSLDLSWSAATDNVGVVGYEVYVGGVKQNTSNITGLSYTVTGLKAWTVYAVYIKAKDQAGNSSNSNTLSVRTADTQAPTAPVLSSPAKTQTSINLSWTAATDNVGIAGYEVFVGGVKQVTLPSTSLGYTLSGLTAGTAYAIYVVAKDSAGNSINSNTLSITTAPLVTETVLREFFFPSSLDGWTPSSTANCLWSNISSLAWEGNGAMLIQSKNTTATSPTLALNGNSQVEIKFYFIANSIENGEKLTLGYNNGSGSSYTTIATFTAASLATGTNFTNNSFYLATVTMNSSSFGSLARLRFTLGGSDVSDKIYIDAISIKGRTGTTATGTTVTLAAATKPLTGTPTKALLAESSLSNNKESGVAVALYPIPATHTLHVNVSSPVHALRIHAIDGSIVHSVTTTSGRLQPLDVSFLKSGMYLAELVLDGQTIFRKFIKQ